MLIVMPLEERDTKVSEKCSTVICSPFHSTDHCRDMRPEQLVSEWHTVQLKKEAHRERNSSRLGAAPSHYVDLCTFHLHNSICVRFEFSIRTNGYVLT